MDETSKKKITRDEIYKSEQKIQEELGDIFSNTMNHRMKEKDTFNTVFPTTGLWKDNIIYKTTNEVTKPLMYKDPYHDKTYYFKTDFNKKFTEEMLKAKNMMTVKKNPNSPTSLDKKASIIMMSGTIEKKGSTIVTTDNMKKNK
jgi:hypothetical protein